MALTEEQKRMLLEKAAGKNTGVSNDMADAEMSAMSQPVVQNQAVISAASKRYCKYCGAVIEAGGNVCQACSRKKKGPGKVIIIGSIIILACIITVLVFKMGLIGSTNYAGVYIADDTWPAMHSVSFNPTMVLHDDGTCQVPHKYGAYGKPEINATYTIDGNKLTVVYSEDVYLCVDRGDEEFGEIVKGGIMWQGIFFKRQ